MSHRSSPKRKIHPNPLGGAVWIAEKGQPWRAQSEFLQIQLDEKAKEEVNAKRIVRMAKQCAEGIKNVYGREYDFAVLQFCIKDAIDLAREDLPKQLKPQVSQQRATELRQIYNAAVAFDIPKLKKLLDISTSNVRTLSMANTAYDFVQQQKQGKTYEETKPTKSIYETLNGRDLVSAKEDNLIKKKRRWRALENFYNALNYHVRIYNRPNNTTWLYDAFDTMDEEGIETMTRQQFVDTCFDLGLGISVQDAQTLVEILDQSNDNRIDYYKVLETMELNMPLNPDDPEQRWLKVPDRCGPPKRRHELRNKGRKKKKKVPDAMGYSSVKSLPSTISSVGGTGTLSN